MFTSPFYICRVDLLYAFFIQWKPDAYGNESQSEVGFVPIEDEEGEQTRTVTNRKMGKDWEVGVSLVCDKCFLLVLTVACAANVSFLLGRAFS